jgi:hypothetical protein
VKPIDSTTTLGQLSLQLTQLGVTDLRISFYDDLMVAILTAYVNDAMPPEVVTGKGVTLQAAIEDGMKQVRVRADLLEVMS